MHTISRKKVSDTPRRSYDRDTYENALELRGRGLSYRRIVGLTGIPKSTIMGWIKYGKKPWKVWPKDKYSKFQASKMLGKKHKPESIEKMRANQPRGAKHYAWKGDLASDAAGHMRAIRKFKAPKGYDRHHIDGNPRNNNPENVLILTRREHMSLDGRLDKFSQLGKRDKSGRNNPNWKGGVK